MRLYSRSVATAAMAALAIGAVSPMAASSALAEPSADSQTLNFVAITDFHGHITQTDKEIGAVGLACTVQQSREADPNTLFVSAGDNVGGSAFESAVDQDNPTMDALNVMGLDVSAAGNHEFDKGHTDLSGRIATRMNAPILAGNVTGDAALTAEGAGDGTFIKEVNGVKVGFVGVVTADLPGLVSPEGLKGLTIADPVKVANEKAAELKKSGKADVVVVLIHEDGAATAPEFGADVDAVVGGHTHVGYSGVVTGAAGNEIAAVQPANYGLEVGKISLTLTKSGDKWNVTERTATETKAAALPKDCAGSSIDQIKTIVTNAKAKADQVGSEVVAHLNSDYLRGNQAKGGAPEGTGTNRGTESTASNVIADSFKAWAAPYANGEKVVGIMNPGGVRTDLAKGDFTKKQSLSLQPFGNEMAYAIYTGAQLKEALAQQWQPVEQADTRPVLTLGVSSNVEVIYNQAVAEAIKANPAGDRSGLISAVYVDNSLLSDTEKVLVGSNNFLLAGGDQFTAFAASPTTRTGTLDYEATTAYLDANKELTVDLAKRQYGVTETRDDAAKTATVRFAGLSFSNVSEQTAPKAGKALHAVVDLADGSAWALADAEINNTLVDWGGPDTGTASLTYTLPDNVATHECQIDGALHRCATVRYFIGNNDQSPRNLAYTTSFDLGAAPADNTDDGDNTVVQPTQPSEQPAQPAGSNTKNTKPAGTLARTGADLSYAILGSAFVASGLILLATRRKFGVRS